MLFAPMPHARQLGTGASSNAQTQYAALFAAGLRVADVAGIVAAGVAAYWWLFGTLAVSIEFQRHLALGGLFAILVFSLSPLYRSWRGRGMAAELWTMLGAYGLMFGISLLYALALDLVGQGARAWWAAWFVAAVGAGSLSRIGIRSAAAWARQRGIDVRTAVIVGTARDANRVAERLRHQPWAGIELLGWFESYASSGDCTLPRLGGHMGLGDYVERVPVNQVWIALPMGAQDEICLVLDQLSHSTADIKFVPDLMGMQLLNHSVEQMAGLPVINLRATPMHGDARLLKAIEDRILAALILVLISPLLAAIAVAVKLTSSGPVLFRQKRHGLDGKEIEVWKFRSMRMHQEAAGQVTQATRHDPRVTPLGRFLRRTSLDELPQFFNVLQGTMSIVGPRPHAIAHNHQYKVQVQHYMQRHRVKPGITGWAQVNGLRGETDTLDKMQRRVEADLFYMQNWSLLLDLRIIVTTIVKGFIGRNAY